MVGIVAMTKKLSVSLRQFLTPILFTCLLALPTATTAYPGERHYEEFLSVYGELLEKHLIPNDKKEGIFVTSVNYAGWAADPLHPQAMAHLERIEDPFAIPPVEQMAFWINVYNYLTVDLIVKEREKDSIRNLDGMMRNIWRIQEWDLFGKDYTLHEIEHEILRPMNEPRIHYAINCASLSCPDLRDTPYRGRGLFTQLEEQEVKFVSDPTKGIYVEFDAKGKVSEIRVSTLYKWYKQDFTGKHSIHELLKKYKQVKTKHAVKFMKYNWDLNGDW